MIWSAVLGTILIVLATIAFGLFVQRKTGVTELPDGTAQAALQRPPQKFGLGEVAATAFRVGDSQLEKVRTTQRCPACRGEMSYAGDADDHVRYDERNLLILHFACSRCDGKRTLYVEHRA
jgi:hypothetical protein